MPLELTYTAIPFVIIAVLFYFTVIVQNDVDGKQPNPDVVVDVTAFQWNWKFGYRTVDHGRRPGLQRFREGRQTRTTHRSPSPIRPKKRKRTTLPIDGKNRTILSTT